MKRIAGKSTRVVILLSVCLFTLLPILWVVSLAFKPQAQAVVYPPEWLPSPATADHMWSVLGRSSFMRTLLNSVVLGVGTVVIAVSTGALGGYAAARYQFKGKQVMLFFLLATFMVPGVVTLIPQYMLAVSLGIHDTYLALILIYSSAQAPLCVWIMRAYYENIPLELDEAARVDGCNLFQAFYRVILPLSWPGLSAAALLAFLWVWSEFIIALTITASTNTRPVTVGLYFFIGETGIEWGRMAFGAALAIAPAAALFLVLQKYFIQGLTAGATKG